MTAHLAQEIRDEHSNTKKLLDVLERNLEAFGEADHVDWNLVDDIVSYCREYPQTCHHPKEDIIYRRMYDRDRAKAEGAGDLLAEHEQLAELSDRLAESIEAIRREAEISRDQVYTLAHEFLDTYRRHIGMEEEFFLPAAELLLSDADWTEAEAEALRKPDPVFGDREIARYQRLRETVVSAAN